MGFDVKHLALQHASTAKSNVWLHTPSTNEYHKVLDAYKRGEGYEVAFHSRPPMQVSTAHAFSTPYMLHTSHIPPLTAQVSRKIVPSSLEVGLTVFLKDGVFKITKIEHNKSVTIRTSTANTETKAIYVWVQTRYGARLCMYKVDQFGVLQAMLPQHTMLALYESPAFDTTPSSLNGMSKSYYPPLKAADYDSEATFILGVSAEAHKTAEQFYRQCVPDVSLVIGLGKVYSLASVDKTSWGTKRACWALSTSISDSATTAPPVVVPTKATINAADLKALVSRIKQQFAVGGVK